MLDHDAASLAASDPIDPDKKFGTVGAVCTVVALLLSHRLELRND